MNDPGSFRYRLHHQQVEFGDGALNRLSQFLDAGLGVADVFLVSTPGRRAVCESVTRDLGDRVRGHFDRAALHVPADLVDQAREAFQATGAEGILALGGGSAIGLGKALARETGAPLAAVPTTYSGSEMTDIWGISDGDRKVTGRDPAAAARLVVYDPLLTRGMPADVTGPSGMNAIAHTVEALYSKTASPLSSLLATEALRHLAATLPRLMDYPGDGDARREAFYGAHLAGRALDLTSMGLHHKLCHVLGGMLGLPHALTHAVVLPYVTAYNRDAAPEAMATIATALGAPESARGLWDLNRRLGIAQTLGDLGMTADDVAPVVDAVVESGVTNPAPVMPDGVRAVLTRAMEGAAPGQRSADI
jgi:maleylacetate reductase